MASVEVCERCRRVVAVRNEDGEALEEGRVAPGDHATFTELCDECRRKAKEETRRLRGDRRTPFDEE